MVSFRVAALAALGIGIASWLLFALWASQRADCATKASELRQELALLREGMRQLQSQQDLRRGLSPAIISQAPATAPPGAKEPVLPRQEVKDLGFQHLDRGWFDASCQGVNNDYCRFVGTVEEPFFSCALAGGSSPYTDAGKFAIWDFDATGRFRHCDNKPTAVAPGKAGGAARTETAVNTARPGEKVLVAIGCPMTSRGIHGPSTEFLKTTIFRFALPTLAKTTAGDIDRYQIVVYAGYDQSDAFWHKLQPDDMMYQHVQVRFVECNCTDMVCNTNCIMKRVRLQDERIFLNRKKEKKRPIAFYFYFLF
jgi:hypothetical protein